MRILIFTSVFYPSIGGIENMTVNLAREFIKEGHQVKIITNKSKKLQSGNIEIYNSPGYIKMMQLFAWCNLFYMPNISLKGVWLLILNPFKKWVVSHNDFYLDDESKTEIKLKRLLIKLASNIAVSKSVADKINTKSEIIYNCYDDSIFKLYKEETREFDFAFVGRLVSQKGCSFLINACKNLKQPFTLNIIGDGPESEKLKSLVNDLGLENHIHFLGFLQGEALAKMLNRHRVLVIPSIGKEGFGIVALEGMACGCKIIASNAGGLNEAVNQFGKIFEMTNQDELSELLNEELNNKTSNTFIQQDLINYLQKHTSNTVARKYLSFFK